MIVDIVRCEICLGKAPAVFSLYNNDIAFCYGHHQSFVFGGTARGISKHQPTSPTQG
jgi:hypothetical protein